MNVRVLYVDRAPARERRRGLLAWLTIVVQGLALPGFALRRTRSGRLCVSFPKRMDAAGRQHPQVWPLVRGDGEALEAAILAQIDLEGLLR